MATHSSTLAWKIPWMMEPGRLQSMGSQSQTQLSNFTCSLVPQCNCEDYQDPSCGGNEKETGISVGLL